MERVLGFQGSSNSSVGLENALRMPKVLKYTESFKTHRIPRVLKIKQASYSLFIFEIVTKDIKNIK